MRNSDPVRRAVVKEFFAVAPGIVFALALGLGYLTPFFEGLFALVKGG